MAGLNFNREQQNLGGVNELSFLFETSLTAAIEIVKSQVVSIPTSTDFTVPDILPESSQFSEEKAGLDLFSYRYTGKVAKDDYEKLQDCILFDTMKVVAIVKDNNGKRRLLGQLNNACQMKVYFDKGEKVADLNHYKLEITWTSRYRAAFISDVFVVPAVLATENGDLLSLESAQNGNKVSGLPIAGTIVGAYFYVILEDINSPTGYSSYQVKLEDFIPEPLEYTPENTANKENTTLDSSTTKYPTNNLVKTYVDGLVAGLLDDRGSYNASGNTFPSSGGSGTAGAIMKGDLWYISVAGMLGGDAVQVGDSIRALTDTPGQTAANWSILNSNIGFVPENVSNKRTTFQSTPDDTHYPSEKLVKDSLDAIKKPYCTVGTGGDYATLSAAFSAGNLNIKAITDITLTGDISIPANTCIFTDSMDTYTLNCGNYQISMGFNAKFDGLNFRRDITSARLLFVGTGTNTEFSVKNVAFFYIVVVNSTSGYIEIADIGNFENIIVSFSGNSNSYFGFGGSASFSGKLKKISIGYGLQTYCCGIYNNSATDIHDVTLTDAGANSFARFYTAKGIYCNSSNILVTIEGDLVSPDGIYRNSIPSLQLSPSYDTKIEKCDITNYSVSYATVQIHFINCNFGSNINLNGTYQAKNKFTACKFGGTVAAAITGLRFLLCTFSGAITFSSTKCALIGAIADTIALTVSGDNNIISSNVLLSITFNAGGDNNTCSGNQTDSAITNNGTGNQLSANAVF